MEIKQIKGKTVITCNEKEADLLYNIASQYQETMSDDEED